jgi:hypothetical protein
MCLKLTVFQGLNEIIFFFFCIVLTCIGSVLRRADYLLKDSGVRFYSESIRVTKQIF